MTGEQIDLAIKAITFALSVLAMIFAWVRTRRQVIDDKVVKVSDKIDVVREDCRERFDRHELRLQSIEQAFRHMPGSEDIHKLQLDLARVVGSLDTMNANLAGQAEIMRRLEAVVGRHEEHLHEGKNR